MNSFLSPEQRQALKDKFAQKEKVVAPKPAPEAMLEKYCSKHYTPHELAAAWGVSAQTIRELFRHEHGVLKIGSDGTKTRRAYKLLRIPASVAERVHNRLSA